MNLTDISQPAMQETVLPNGTRIWWGRAAADRPAWQLVIDREHAVVMHFTLTGTIALEVAALNRLIHLRTNEHNIVYPGAGRQWLHGQATHPGEFVQVQLAPEFFAQFLEPTSSTLQHLLEQVRTGQPSCLATVNLPVTPAMHTVLAQIMKCPLTCSLKRLFLEAKVLELLALQLSQYEQHLMGTESRAQPPDYDKLIEARRLLETHFDNPPTLAELSRLVGLNEFQLKKRFKEVFDDTIYGWVLNYRLEQAYQLLQRHHLAISEVAYQVGYQHPAHFTTAFKKKFGIVPSAVK